jgi:hypothetical protein
MRRFVEGVDRGQRTLFPECLEDWIDEGNPVRAIDAFVEKLDLSGLGFDGVAPEAAAPAARCRKFRRGSFILNLPSHHSITSSARSRNESGIVRPSALAVVRLTTSSNLDGCSTGMSPGFVPRRILSTNSAARRN